MRRVWLVPLAFLVVAAAPLTAQWQLTGETGMSRLKQASIAEANALTLGATLEGATERTFLRSSLLGAGMTDGRWTGQWLTVGALATQEWNSTRLQLTGAISAFGQSHIAATNSADALVQARVGTGARGLAFGGGFGATGHNDVSIPVKRAVADAWWSYRDERFTAGAAITRTPSVFGESSIIVADSRIALTYLDVTGGWRHERAAWSIGASVGMRGRDGSVDASRASYLMDGEAWLAPRLAVVVSGGRTLEDLVRGVPRASFASIALRLSSRPHATVFVARSAAGPRLLVSGEAPGPRRVEIRAPGATRVELMADFTEWNAIALERTGDVWRLERVIPSGPHRVAIRIDGGEWIVPANLPRVEDDLGGGVGLITVP